MTKYEVIETEFYTSIRRYNEDGSFTAIPMDEGNADYQAYLNKDKPQVEHLTEIPTN
jgi:hypothetical protein